MSSVTATPHFAAKPKALVPQSSFRYHYPEAIQLSRLERFKAYGSTRHLKAGFRHATDWLKGKGVVGKIVAGASLLGAWALEFMIAPFSAGVWTVGKVFYPNLNLSGLGRAFHYGVQKSYELARHMN
ncbi:MAG: hypothetical protein U0003_01310 [Vampirovibrionales bacterium]